MSDSQLTRIGTDANTKALKIAAKVNAKLSDDGVSISKKRVIEAATNAFYEECASLEGEAFDKWIIAMFKGDF